MKKSFYFPLMMILILTGTISISMQVQKVNVTGTWNMTVETGQGSGNPVLVLKQVNDSVITGTYTGQFGQADLKGIVKGNRINIRISASDIAMDYIGTVEDNSMKGKVVFGEYGEGTFTGKKKTE
jgi:hypothetical protein